MRSTNGCSWDAILAEATARVAAGLTRDETTDIGERRDLQPRIRNELARLCCEFGDYDYIVDSSEKTLPLPNWKPRPGGLDVGVRNASDKTLACAIELKLRELSWTLWDFYKMADALLLEDAPRAYLIVGATRENWHATARERCIELFDPDGPAEMRSADLFARNKLAWFDLLQGGSARPTAIPGVVSSRVIAVEPFELDRRAAELRCIAVERRSEAHLDFPPTWHTGDWPESVSPPDPYWPWRRGHLALASRLNRAGGSLPLKEVARLRSLLKIDVHPTDGVRERGLVYRGGQIVRRSGDELRLTALGARFLDEWQTEFTRS